jgi:hypothetical protein
MVLHAYIYIYIYIYMSHRNDKVGGKNLLDVVPSVIHVTFVELRQCIVAQLLCGILVSTQCTVTVASCCLFTWRLTACDSYTEVLISP